MHRARALFPVILISAFVALLAASAPATAKPVKCKGSKIPVTVGKRTTCVPIGKALPKPKQGDPRVADLQESLPFARFGAAGKRAERKLVRVLPRVLARIDRRAAERTATLGPTAFASACSANGPLDAEGSIGGVGIAASGDNGAQLTVRIKGQVYRLRFATCGGTAGLYVPECPRASGEVSARSRGSIEVTDELREDDRVLFRQNTSIDTVEKGRGQVGADAKLDYLDYGQIKETFIVATGGIVHRGKVERQVRIDMRAGGYDPAGTSVKASGDEKASDGADGFASAVKYAIRDYRFAEKGGDFLHTDGWTTFGRNRGAYCAEPVFSPPSETLKLKKGERGQLGIYAKARADGGKAAGAKWTLLAPLNATFEPGSSESAGPSFSYTVTNAPAGGRVQVTVKFTSTAGVGEKTWTQPTEPRESVNHIEGTIGGETSQTAAVGPPSVQKWSGTAGFDLFAGGVYMLGSGSVSIELSGTDSSGVTGCLQSGSAQAPLTSGSMNVTGSGPEGGPPFDYSIQIAMPFVAVKGTRHDCPSGAAMWEGTQFDAVPLWSLNVTGEQSPDGLTFAGSETESFGGLFQERHWNLLGKP